MHGTKGAAIDLGLLGARGDADRKCAGEETREADEALRAEQLANGRHHGTAAEIEEIDDQQVGNAAQDGCVGFGK
ncbi:hypothetical protein D9M70_550990 [compost metagenome]